MLPQPLADPGGAINAPLQQDPIFSFSDTFLPKSVHFGHRRPQKRGWRPLQKILDPLLTIGTCCGVHANLEALNRSITASLSSFLIGDKKKSL